MSADKGSHTSSNLLEQGWQRLRGIPDSLRHVPGKLRDAYRSMTRKRKILLATGVTLTFAGAAELKTSFVQTKIFHKTAQGKIFTKSLTMNDSTAAPAFGPYDARLGYTQTLKFRENLKARGYVLNGETTWQERSMLGISLFPIYNEKAQAGLRIIDGAHDTLYNSPFPQQVYTDFNAIPPVVVNSLLFVENRTLLEEHPDSWNPAIEWGRLTQVIFGRALETAGLDGSSAGASTLATQKEKFRHSPRGITSDAREKLKQMLTASVRAYQDDENTVNDRRNIVLDYLNAMPLSAFPGKGEIHGFADGMSAWFGADFNEVNALLTKPESQMDDAEMLRAGRAYREALSLVMSVKKPSAYLQKDRKALDARVDAYLPLLAKEGIISKRMCDAALTVHVQYAEPVKRSSPPLEKSVSSLQVDLLNSLGIKSLYDLSRLDITAHTTIDGAADRAVSAKLKNLAIPDTAAAYGLTGYRLLKPETAPDIVYAFTLYERMPDGTNALRVQTDNFNGPLNLNEGSKLELGSTAKLRTLISYLEAVEDLHSKYARLTAPELQAVKLQPEDRLGNWMLGYLARTDTDKSLEATLNAALDRTYSASPGESFFTGGGMHRFENFDNRDNGRVVTVREAMHKSINLPFIRIMRDIVRYTESQKMHVDADLFTNPENPDRTAYLRKFALSEGESFLWKAWTEQRGKTTAEVAALLADKTGRKPSHLAVVYRTLYPAAPAADMEAFVRKHMASSPGKTDFKKLYEDYAPGKFDLNDLGYITGVHPLALWLAGHKAQNPDATWDQSLEASAGTRVFVYKWLFKPGKEQAQNTRIRTMLEQEAFTHIHKTWKEKGFPFNAMTPSYASALGASGDNPAALSTLAGILQNNGVLIPVTKFTGIEFAANTPYQLSFDAGKTEPKRVLPEVITKLVRAEMQKVVEEGTARRAYHSIQLSDGHYLPVGAKTGTGDNRFQTFAANGAVKSSDAKSRTATFVYIIDDRFFGCVTAYVDGPSAGKFKFTSALPAQVFKALTPDIQPLLDRSYGVTPKPGINAPAVSVPRRTASR